MITHTIESYWIPSQNKTGSKLQILKQTLHATNLLKLLNKMCKYELDLTSIVEDTERTWFCPQTDRRKDGQTDRQTDRQTDKVKPVYPPFNFVEAGGIIKVNANIWKKKPCRFRNYPSSLSTDLSKFNWHWNTNMTWMQLDWIQLKWSQFSN